MNLRTLLCILTFSTGTAFSQTLSAGDIVFVSFKTSSSSKNGFFTLFARKPIPANTTVRITNKYYRGNTNPKSFSSTSIKTGSGYTSSVQGEISLLFNEPVSVGQTFQVVFTETNNVTTVTSTVGSCSFSGSAFDFGNTDDDRIIWLYEPVSGSDVNVVTAIMYSEGTGNNAWTNFHSTPPASIVFSQLGNTTNSNVTALNLDISGSSNKCGAWTMYQAGTSTQYTSIDLNADLKNTFYKKADWIFTTSNSIDPCSASSVASTVQSWLETNVSFPKKLRYGHNGARQWEDFSSGSWSNITEPTWTSGTYKDFEISLYRTYYLDSSTVNSSSSPAASTKNLECAKLRLVNKFTSSQSTPVRLILGAGSKLTVHYSVSMTDSNSVVGSSPSVRLESAHFSGVTQYAMIAPTSATLNGTYSAVLTLVRPGWHHLQSPISSTFANISVAPLSGATGAFAFTPGAVGTGNFFKWDPSQSQWSQGLTSENFSSEPYAIYLNSSEVPLQLTVSGAIVNSDQDAIANLAANYHNPSTTGSFGNVPGWTSDGSDGWNFYGNPYLSAVSATDLLGYFSSSGSNSGNKMTGLQNKIYVWQPDGSASNLTSNYLNRSFDGTTHTGDNGASYLPPFQAFFLRCTSSNNAGASNGLTKSKKYRSTAALGSSTSILNKMEAESSQYQLTLKSANGTPAHLYVAPSADGTKNYQSAWDVLEGSQSSTVFGAAYDGKLFKIKYWPIRTDSAHVDVLVSNPNQGAVFSLESEQGGYLFDRHTQTLHSLSQGPYVFAHQTALNTSARFAWYFTPQTGLGNIENRESAVLVSYIGSRKIEFQHPSLTRGVIYDMNGRLLAQCTAQNGRIEFDGTALTPGIYVLQSNLETTKFIIAL